MDFEKIKAAWQQQPFEGYLSETGPSRVAADVRRKALELNSRHAAEDALRVLGAIFMVGILVFLYDSRQPPLAQAGMILLMIGIVLEGLAHLWMHFRYRGPRYDLPRNDFLLRQRNKLQARIELSKASLTWLSVPMLTGCILYLASVVRTLGQFSLIAAAIAIVWAILIRTNSKRIRKRLIPLLDAINQKLAEIESKQP
jgi:hypothetical protein